MEYREQPNETKENEIGSDLLKFIWCHFEFRQLGEFADFWRNGAEIVGADIEGG